VRSLAEGLEATVRWYIDHKEWWEDIFQSGRYGGERLGLDAHQQRPQVTGA
jgi:dTDP-glucose 4,6-dehydratase